jgi:MFS family permease
MIYPLLPVFVAMELGGGAATLGFIEGLAEATAALGKAMSGMLADRARSKKPFLLMGYGISGLARPLLGLVFSWPAAAAVRFADRVGKGLRTSPRDALIAQAADPRELGRAFGFHRSMDHAGAVLGPVVAAALLHAAGLSLREVFLLAALPALAVMVVLWWRVKEPAPAAPPATEPRLGFREAWAKLDRDYRTLLLALLVFTLGNSADAFLLLRLSEAGAEPWWLAILWSVLHMVKMTANIQGGPYVDRLGPKKALLIGWGLYAVAYLGMGLAQTQSAMTLAFLFYGFHFGLSEPGERTLVARLAPKDLHGTAFGLYHGLVGLAALPASLIFGLVWKFLGAPTAFALGACLAAAAGAILYTGLAEPERG